VLVAGVLLLLVGAFLLVLLRTGVAGGAPVFHGTAYEPPEPAPPFTLVGHTGRSASLSDYQGRPVLLFFGFVNCPDVCPLTLTRLDRALETLGRRAEDVQILLVTVDPERDTPEALAEYVRAFGARIDGLTGDPETLARIRADYGAYAEANAGGGDHHPQVVHTSAVFGIDRAGQLRVLLHADRPEEQLRDDLRTLLSL
jgi:protein SCO1/2